MVHRNDFGPRLLRNLAEVVGPGAARRLDGAFHQRPVDLADRAAFELLGDPPSGADVPRQNQRP
jgi:hypothetical protein